MQAASHPVRRVSGGDNARGRYNSQTGRGPDKVPEVDHSVGAQRHARLNQWDHFHGCTAATGYACISGYLPSAIPNLAALADHGVLLTNAFTLHNAPSWGGHLDEFAGTMDGFTVHVPPAI